MNRVLGCLRLACAIATFANPLAKAAELWSTEDGAKVVTLNTTLKTSSLVSHNDADAVLHKSDWSGLGLYRVRFDLSARFGDEADAQFAYEHSGRWTSRDHSAGGRSGILPSAAAAPFRLTQLYDDSYESDRVTGYHELDRALFSLHPDWGEVVIGRQAIGLGRGRLFSAVDMFSPFSPLEVDREWRRGVDAIRTECRLSPTSSVEAILVGGESWDESALVLRARGYFGNLDVELLGGKRGEDECLAGVFSAALGDAEIHGELAVFRTPEPHPDGEPLGDDRVVPKLVLGSSCTFDVGNGLTLLGEYHYSGFGAKDTGEATSLFARPEYKMRLLRGDTQIIGRHALGLQASYPCNESLNGTLSVLMNPADGSGTVSPSIRWDLSRTTSLTVTGYIPWGAESQGGILQSEHGASPRSLFVQVGYYF